MQVIQILLKAFLFTAAVQAANIDRRPSSRSKDVNGRKSTKVPVQVPGPTPRPTTTREVVPVPTKSVEATFLPDRVKNFPPDKIIYVKDVDPKLTYKGKPVDNKLVYAKVWYNVTIPKAKSPNAKNGKLAERTIAYGFFHGCQPGGTATSAYAVSQFGVFANIRDYCSTLALALLPNRPSLTWVTYTGYSRPLQLGGIPQYIPHTDHHNIQRSVGIAVQWPRSGFNRDTCQQALFDIPPACQAPGFTPPRTFGGSVMGVYAQNVMQNFGIVASDGGWDALIQPY